MIPHFSNGNEHKRAVSPKSHQTRKNFPKISGKSFTKSSFCLDFRFKKGHGGGGLKRIFTLPPETVHKKALTSVSSTLKSFATDSSQSWFYQHPKKYSERREHGRLEKFARFLRNFRRILIKIFLGLVVFYYRFLAFIFFFNFFRSKSDLTNPLMVRWYAVLILRVVAIILRKHARSGVEIRGGCQNFEDIFAPIFLR